MKLHLAILGLILLPFVSFSQRSFKVETHKLNFRSGPGADYSAIFSLDEGDEVKYIKPSQNGWWLVEYNGIKGYVASKYLEPTSGFDFSSQYSTSTLQKVLSSSDDWILKNNNHSSNTTLPNSFYPDWQNSSSNQTSKVGETEYYLNDFYSTTGLPKVKRSMAARKEFLERWNYKEVPKGYEVDHIIPLSEGGADEYWNMQLLTVDEHKKKTARERASHSTISTASLKLNSYNTTTTIPFQSYQSDKTIYTGSRGGQYYINSNGNKVYVKSTATENVSHSNISTSSLKLKSYNTTTKTIPSQSYQSGKTIYTGPRGGQYYINSNGNKTYVKGKN